MRAPDYVLTAAAKILTAPLPLVQRAPGPLAASALYARYRAGIAILLADTRAAARSGTLAADIALVLQSYRLAASDQRAVINGLERLWTAARAYQPTPVSSGSMALQRANEMALCLLFETVALAEAANAVADIGPRSYNEASSLRQRFGSAFDLAIDRASDQGAIDVQRALRALQARVTRDLIERGRSLARVSAYQTAVPLPAVVLAHILYQNAGRAPELVAENAATDHPSFMPVSGLAYTQ